MNLTYQDIQEIVRLLDDSPYDELKLKTGEIELALQRSGDSQGWSQDLRTAPRDNATEAARPVAASTPDPRNTEISASEAGLLDIRAPMVGTFYRAPKPGSDPFVDVGSHVEENTVIAIIEVMKLMSSIPAGVKGEVVEILVDDASYVEKGQLMMRVRPDSA